MEDERLRALAKLTMFGTGICLALVAGVIAMNAVFTAFVEHRLDYDDRRNAEVRCPWDGPGVAEVRLGGWGEPDYCSYQGSSGQIISEPIIAQPVPD